MVHAVRLRGALAGPDGLWVGNLHAQLGRWERQADGAPPTEVTGRPGADVALAAARLQAWSRAAAARREAGTDGTPAVPLLLGGDLNLPAGDLATVLPAGWRTLASAGPDHLTGRGLLPDGRPERPDRGALSDHAPLLLRAIRLDAR